MTDVDLRSSEADSPEAEHYGYEVEYLTATTVSVTGGGSNGVRSCAHPSAREYSVDSTGVGERAPTLRLQDEDGEEIAAYSGMAWLAIRKMARPSSSPSSGRTW